MTSTHANVAAYGAAAFSDGTALFAAGGIRADGTSPRSLLRIDATTGRSEAWGAQLLPRHYGTAVVHGDDAYLVGGMHDGQAVAPVEKVAMSSGAVTIVTSLPTPREFPGAALFNGRIYVAGGATASKERVTKLDIFDLETGAWSAGPALGVARDTRLVAVDGALFALPGYDGKKAVPVVERLAADGTRWDRLADAPGATSAFASVVIGHSVLLFGDYERHEQVLSFTPATGVWERMPMEYSARRHAAAALVGNHVVVYGGNLASRSSSAVDTVEVYALLR